MNAKTPLSILMMGDRPGRWAGLIEAIIDAHWGDRFAASVSYHSHPKTPPPGDVLGSVDLFIFDGLHLSDPDLLRWLVSRIRETSTRPIVAWGKSGQNLEGVVAVDYLRLVPDFVRALIPILGPPADSIPETDGEFRWVRRERPARIVMIDDVVGVLDMLESVIRGWFLDPTILTFTDAAQGLRELEREDPDLLTTDWVHAPPRGDEILRWLAERNAGYPALVMSTSASPAMIRKAMGPLQNVSWLPKPFLLDLLYWHLLRLVGCGDRIRVDVSATVGQAGRDGAPAGFRTNGRRFTLLAGDDQFAEPLAALVWEELRPRGGLHLERFKTEAEMWQIVRERPVDLVFAYLGNVQWAAGEGDHSQRGLNALDRLKSAYGIPVIATQGLYLFKQAAEAGVTFLPAPFTADDIKNLVRSCGLLPLKPTGPGSPQPLAASQSLGTAGTETAAPAAPRATAAPGSDSVPAHLICGLVLSACPRPVDRCARSKRVIAADPNPLPVEALQRLLAAALDFEVVRYGTTEEFLTHFRPGVDRWVFLDRTTPTLHDRLLEEVRRVDPTIPFFFHTAYAPLDAREWMQRNGANGCVDKPWKSELLAAALRHFDAEIHAGRDPGFLWYPCGWGPQCPTFLP